MEPKRHFFIRAISQKDNFHFTVEWTDGKISTYRLSDLQHRCPCAKCIDEMTGQRLAHPEQVDRHVKAVKLSSVGRYAIRIQFTSGCSTGIYHYDLLRELG